MRILYLSHRIPYPPDKGEKIRAFHAIRHLSGRHELHLGFLVDDSGDLRHVDALRPHCASLEYAVIHPGWRKLMSLRHLLTRSALSVPYFHHPALQRAIDARLRETAMDAVICFSSPMAEYVFRSKALKAALAGVNGAGAADSGATGRPRLIMDFVDVDSEKWRAYAQRKALPLKPIFAREARRLREYEQKVAAAFDWSVFVTEREARLFRTFCPQARTAVVPNGVDWEHFVRSGGARMERWKAGHGPVSSASLPGPSIVFMGAMDYYPNEDGVLWFAEEVYPLIKRELPGARFTILGPRPSERLRRLERRYDGISVTGYVPDVRPYLRDADVFVAPLRIARGVQNKVLEAMAAGVPVVARPEAADGVGGHESCLRVEAGPVGFASAVCDIWRDRELARRLVGNAQKLIRGNYSWERSLASLEVLLDTDRKTESKSEEIVA